MIRTILFLLISNDSVSFAATQENGFSIESSLTYKSDNKTVTTSDELILPIDSRHWVSLISPKDGVSVLGKLVTSTPTTVHIEYIVLDNSKKPNNIISTPSIVSKLGEKAEIKIEGPESVKISLLARPIQFESKPNP
jgi:hypothetical protein